MLFFNVICVYDVYREGVPCVPVEAKEQLCGAGSFLPFVREFQESNSDCQAVWQPLNQLSNFPKLKLTFL